MALPLTVAAQADSIAQSAAGLRGSDRRGPDRDDAATESLAYYSVRREILQRFEDSPATSPRARSEAGCRHLDREGS